MKCIPSDSILAPYFKIFIQERVERLVLEGEKLPGFLRGKEELVPMRKQATEAMGEDEAGCLINAARSLDIPIFEYIYQTGIMDGIRMTTLIEQVKKG